MKQRAPYSVAFARESRRCFVLWLALFAPGCQSGESISGELLLEGMPIAGEILFEPLDAEGVSTGRAETVFADPSGEFHVALTDIDEAEHVRIVIRATPVSEEGLPGTFDSQQLPDKVVTLRRTLPLRKSMVFALTR